MSILELLGSLDWWQLGWLLAGLFFVLMVGTMVWSRGLVKKGSDQGWHERQHMESDEMLKAAIHHAFDKKG